MGVFLRNPSPYLREFWKKITENSKRLGRQVRSGFEPGTFRLLVLSVIAMPLVGNLTKILIFLERVELKKIKSLLKKIELTHFFKRVIRLF